MLINNETSVVEPEPASKYIFFKFSGPGAGTGAGTACK
jgi:hypothetical protein